MSDGIMSPDQAEQAVWAFFWQVAHSRDRRRVMTPEDQAAVAAEAAEARSTLMSDLGRKIDRAVARWFGDRKREEVGATATADALAELEGAAAARPGRVNHATGLPESAADLDQGPGVVSGIDLAMSVLVPTFALAAASTAWLPPDGRPEVESDWQVLAFKPMKRQCVRCRGVGRTDGPKCVACAGSGRVRKGGFMSREWVDCGKCSGRGCASGSACSYCDGRGSADNWSQEEATAVRENASMIARVVERLAGDGLFNARPIHEADAEMGDLSWQNDEGCTIGFKLTYKGWKHMQEYIDKRPELKRSLHTLVYAGEEVRNAAPGWAQDEYRRGS